MGMDLSGAGGYFRWTNTGWGKVLELASANGWEPIGTGPPKGTLKDDWTGGYFGNDSQRVYARDGKRLADALESHLLKSPEDEIELREFIEFCRAGSFRIQ